MKSKYFLFLCLSFLIFNSSLLIGTVRYVSKTGTSTPPYTSWQTAADSIQKCINICIDGDTVYVANGIYKEQIIMLPGLSLIGAGMDSCVINFQMTGMAAVQFADSCHLSGFKIIVPNTLNTLAIESNGHTGLVTLNKIVNASQGIYVNESDVTVYKNIFENIKTRGVNIFNSNSIIRMNLIYTDPNSQSGSISGIYIGGFDFTYKPIIDSNFIEVNSGDGIRNSIGSKPTITNNTIIVKYAPEAIHLYMSDTTKVFNNLIISSTGAGSGIFTNGVTMHAYNNYLTGDYFIDLISMSPNNLVKNNVISSTSGTISTYSVQNLFYKYNNIWNSDVTYSGFAPDSTNLSVDPMIVNEDTTQGELDFHLQKYSPLIDAGDPNILDRDGSRSDIGLYGGSYGWTYTYNDLAPRPPHNVTAVNEDGLIKLTWNKNTEADFSHYRIYRDTVSILIYDSTRIVGTTSDTVFYDNLPPSNTEKNYYYLITAFDDQGNQSAPSEEINVTITGLSEHPPIEFDNYALLSNYPNPFNPSTIIPYRLKEGGYVKLYIYDMKGELVKTLVNQWQASGYYEILFQPNTDERKKASSLEVPMGRTYSDMSSGVYLYQISVRGEGDIPVFSDMGKMILMK